MEKTEEKKITWPSLLEALEPLWPQWMDALQIAALYGEETDAKRKLVNTLAKLMADADELEVRDRNSITPQYRVKRGDIEDTLQKLLDHATWAYQSLSIAQKRTEHGVALAKLLADNGKDIEVLKIKIPYGPRTLSQEDPSSMRLIKIFKGKPSALYAVMDHVFQLQKKKKPANAQTILAAMKAAKQPFDLGRIQKSLTTLRGRLMLDRKGDHFPAEYVMTDHGLKSYQDAT